MEIIDTKNWNDVPPFQGFGKIPRLDREIIITEKIDGTNAQVVVTESGEVYAGSRTQYISTDNDNHGFAKWVEENKEELLGRGVGRHFGEWWGSGINRGYGLAKGEKRFSLFNVKRWCNGGTDKRPECCGIVPVLYWGRFSTVTADGILYQLKMNGSKAVPGFMKPEGIMVYHTAGNLMFKKTIEKDEEPKGKK